VVEKTFVGQLPPRITLFQNYTMSY